MVETCYAYFLIPYVIDFVPIGLRTTEIHKSMARILKSFVFLLTQKVHILTILQQLCCKMLKPYVFWAKITTKYCNLCAVDLRISALRLPKCQPIQSQWLRVCKHICSMSLPSPVRLIYLNKPDGHIWTEIDGFLECEGKKFPQQLILLFTCISS